VQRMANCSGKERKEEQHKQETGNYRLSPIMTTATLRPSLLPADRP